MVLNALDIESSRLPRSLGRFDRPCAVKKLTGLSSALLTRLPVASFVCVCVISSEVFCNCRRFARTPAERTISLIVCPSGPCVRHHDPHGIGNLDLTVRSNTR